jgi:hypothetical protein
MKEEKIKELLNEMSQHTTEEVPSGLGEEIKENIPIRLPRHKINWDTISIIIDLRMSKSIAAAVIIISAILMLNWLGGRDPVGRDIFQDGMLFLEYWRDGAFDTASSRLKYQHLLRKGEDVIWYGDNINQKDPNAVLFQYRLPDGTYEVTFVDGRAKKVTSEELVILLARMLKNSE